jgi:pilus assembly protein CpaC
MRRITSALLGALLLAGWAAPVLAQARGGESQAAENGSTITLAIGETKVISAREVKNYSEGVAGIVDIKLTSDASQFVINGRRAGSTTLLLIKNDGSQTTLNIDVFTRSPQAVERELAQLLDGLNGVQVRRVGAHIVIDGTVADDAELKRVQHVASLYPNEVDSLVTIGSAAPTAAGPEPTRYIVRIDFYFVQYDSSSTFAAGIGWPASIGGGPLQTTLSYDFLLGAPHSATATLVNQPLPRLDIASTRGWAKVLKQATVITNNGVEATFSNGGEQNFSVTTGLGVGVQRIPYGTEVTVLPKYNATQREIDVKVTADIADLTASVTGSNLPGRTTSKLVTSVSLKLGQSLVLSGIRRESTSHQITGIPGLKDIPVLGVLFASHSDDTQATEGAVFIVPSVVEAIPNSAQELVDGALARFRDYHGDIDKARAYDRRPGGGVGAPPQPSR